MKRCTKWFANVIAVAGSLAIVHPVMADTTIAVFDENFYMDGLFAWSDAVVVADSTGYSITDTGYGSGYKDINPNIDATGETIIEVTVTISASGVGPDDPASGPIVSLVDGDGTFWNYAWYGQTIGTHVLTALLSSPTFTSGNGTVPGLDLSTLDFFHLQDDPGAYHGQYTIVFQKFRLIGPPLTITPESYNPATHEFTLTWTSLPGKSYTILHTSDLTNAFSPLITDVASGGASTTNTVTIPEGGAGFLRILQQ